MARLRTGHPQAGRPRSARRGRNLPDGPGALLLSVPGHSPLHRAPLALKYPVLLAVGLMVMIWRNPVTGLTALALSLLLYVLTGLSWQWLALLRSWWWVILVLGAYQYFFASAWQAVALVSGMVGLLQLARLLLLTTPTSAILDGLGAAAARLRIPASMAEVTLALILRTIPDLSAAWRRSTEAARARGTRRNPLRSATHVATVAVARGRDAGDALAARGLPAEQVTP